MKKLLSLTLAVLLAFVLMPVKAADAAEPAPKHETPAGYNENDYQKLVAFLETEDENGVKNGEKITEYYDWDYDPQDPETWGNSWYIEWYDTWYYQGVCWSDGAEKRVIVVDAGWHSCVGTLDVSGCSELFDLNCDECALSAIDASGCSSLRELRCSRNGIFEEDEENWYAEFTLTELDISGCSALELLSCSENALTELDVSDCPELYTLWCSCNALTELDVSVCPALNSISCSGNMITELDVSACPELEYLSCNDNELTELDVTNCTGLRGLGCAFNNLSELDVTNNPLLYDFNCEGNHLTSLDLSNNPLLCYDMIRAEGSGYIGYEYYLNRKAPERDSDTDGYIYAYPVNGAEFLGFYDQDGNIVSEVIWDEYYNTYFFNFWCSPVEGEIIARFSGPAIVPGDLSGDGSVSVADAIMTLRASMGVIELTPEQELAGDVTGDGQITVADAIRILRLAMGI